MREGIYIYGETVEETIWFRGTGFVCVVKVEVVVRCNLGVLCSRQTWRHKSTCSTTIGKGESRPTDLNVFPRSSCSQTLLWSPFFLLTKFNKLSLAEKMIQVEQATHLYLYNLYILYIYLIVWSGRKKSTRHIFIHIHPFVYICRKRLKWWERERDGGESPQESARMERVVMGNDVWLERERLSHITHLRTIYHEIMIPPASSQLTLTYSPLWHSTHFSTSLLHVYIGSSSFQTSREVSSKSVKRPWQGRRRV